MQDIYLDVRSLVQYTNTTQLGVLVVDLEEVSDRLMLVQSVERYRRQMVRP